jgi:stage V sporulation protein AC
MSNISQKEYGKMTKKASPPSPILPDCVKAFIVGGLVCCFGQLLFNLYKTAGLDEKTSKMLVSASLIFITAVLTACHIYERYAKFAGAGSLVPITGFANAMVSPAIEFKAEGQILGLGVKMFTVAGPVLVYGITASCVYGVVLWIISLVGGM